jgi:hypothetical protein
MSRRSLPVLALVAAAFAVAVLRIAWRDARTDEERIRALFEDAARAAEEKRVSDAVEAVSERFRGAGLDRRGVKQLVAFHVLRGEWVSVSVAGARLAVDGPRARAAVDAVLARSSGKGKSLAMLLPGEASVHRFDLALEREEDGWRVVEASWRPVPLAEALAGPPEPSPVADGRGKATPGVEPMR